MKATAHDGLVNVNIPVPDFQIKAAIRIGTDPRLVMDGCPLAAKIGQGHQVSRFTLLALGESKVFHEVHLPNQN